MKRIWNHLRLCGPCLGLLALLLPAPARAGSPNAFRTLVVVNTQSVESVELGDYYAAQHGIPPHHICEVSIAPNTVSLTSHQFFSLLRDPINNHIAAENLAGQIDFVVLCYDLPTRVRNVEGVTASLFYGFHNAPSYHEAGRCNLPEETASDYYLAERAFRSADGWNNTNGFVAFHLTTSNLPTAKLVADRGAAAQSTFPEGHVYLAHRGDGPRGVREQRFDNAQFSFLSLPGLPIGCTIQPYYSTLSGKTNVIGYHDGYGNISDLIRTNNTWLTGAYADHMTSCGGMLPDPCLNQSTVRDWMTIGATASYGTVAEPCNYAAKFPDSIMGFYYARGFTIGEAYTMSVWAPYQGLFAGDPLAAPFAAGPLLTITNPAPGQVVTGALNIAVAATNHALGAPAAGLDVYLDGRFHDHLAAIHPTPGNQLAIALNGHTNAVTLTPNQTLFEAVAALADDINNDVQQTVWAIARGDRLELIYRKFDHHGDNLPLTATVAQGSADELTLGVGLTATELVPSIYHARAYVALQVHNTNNANAGDLLTCHITLTNGITVTNTFVADQGEKIPALLERVRSAINSHPDLTATNGVVYDRLASSANSFGAIIARSPGPTGPNIHLSWHVAPVSTNSGLTTNANFISWLTDNANDTRPRASVLYHLRPTNGTLAAEYALDTTTLNDGPHTLDIIARDGSAVAAASRVTIPIVVANQSTTTGVPHWWLAQHGWTNNFEDAALDDPDGDGYATWQEYLAGTDPTNAASRFQWSVTETEDAFAVSIEPTSTNRHYWLDATPDLIAPDWINLTNAPGPANHEPWEVEIPAPVNIFNYYRYRVTLPPE